MILHTNLGLSNVVGAIAVRETTGDSFGNGVAKLITFENTPYDSHGFWTAAAPGRLSVPTGIAGKFLVTAGVTHLQGSNGVGVVYSWLQQRNSADVVLKQSQFNIFESTSFNTSFSDSSRLHLGVIPMSGGDYIQLQVYHNGGGTKSISTEGTNISLFKVAEL